MKKPRNYNKYQTAVWIMLFYEILHRINLDLDNFFSLFGRGTDCEQSRVRKLMGASGKNATKINENAPQIQDKWAKK